MRGRTLLLPGPDDRLSLTAVDNLAEACLAAVHWPAGAYNVTDAEPYRRDAAVGDVLASATGAPVRIRHVPEALAGAVVTLAGATARLTPSGQPVLSRYAVDQLARGVVLDIGRARAQGWTPRHRLADYLAALRSPATRSGGPLRSPAGAASAW